MSFISSPFPSCFRPSHPTDDDPHHSPPSLSTNPNLVTYLYHTDTGMVSLTWSRSILGRYLHVHLHPHHSFDSPSLPSSFHLHIKPFILWKKHGFKKLSPNTHIFWNFSRTKFGSGPEPESGFYIAVVVNKDMILLVGDSSKEAFAKSKSREPRNTQFLVLKREHVVVDEIYTTRAKFGGKMREIKIDCSYRENPRLCFSVDGQRVLQIKRLKWKFRGNERVEVDGVLIRISWDVYNWLFEKEKSDDAHAIFMFKFEEEEEEGGGGGEDEQERETGERNLMNLWTQRQNWNSNELAKMGKSWSWSSMSMSSSAGSFGGSSSVQEWSSVEENELVEPIGFSLVLYAWKR